MNDGPTCASASRTRRVRVMAGIDLFFFFPLPCRRAQGTEPFALVALGYSVLTRPSGLGSRIKEQRTGVTIRPSHLTDAEYDGMAICKR